MTQQTTGPRWRKYLRWVGWTLLIQFILINISAALYAYKLSQFSTDQSLRNSGSSKNIFVKTWRIFSGPRQVKSIVDLQPAFAYDKVLLKTKSGLLIEGWYARADSAARGTVVLVHGVTLSKSLLIHEASDFRYQGFNVLLIDLRAHGNSEGTVTTLGVKEGEEVQLAFDWLRSKGEKNIILWGSSMGAVAIARAIAHNHIVPQAVILEMPFANLQTYLQAKARMLGFQGLPEKPFGFFVSFWMGIERGFNGWKHSTVSYVKNISCPVLLQWGERDEIVSRNETDRIFNAIASRSKKMVVYAMAGHESLLQNNAAKWRLEVEGFLNNVAPSQ